MKVKIFTGNEQYSAKRRGGYRAYVHHLLRMRYGIAPDWEMCDQPVTAWVNQGNWAANCECGGSMIVEPGEPYICPDCVNAAQGGKARPVIWPDEKKDIEDILVMRPFQKNRNWLKDETVEMLVDENLAHSDGVPAEILAKVRPIEPPAEEPPIEIGEG